MKATEATDKSHDQPHVEKNVRLVEETRSGAGAPGFDMRLAWVPAIVVLLAIYAVIRFFG